MSRPRAILRFFLRLTKWATLAAALLVAAVWVCGRSATFTCFPLKGGPKVTVSGLPGGVFFGYGQMMDSPAERLEYLTFVRRHVWIWRPSVNPAEDWATGQPVRIWTMFNLEVPYWIPTLLFGSVSGSLLWLDRRATRRFKTGHCPACGYSLAGLANGARCPECAARPS